ncbi:hypothetical protein IFM89_000798 [Coptis chinensis]|uniref:Cytochrome P450 n=1 Tax=Coptis chinensis TaxID=261450 RepID=A0A835ITV5_9MAGN|nr:hypothetical protein IFM89_000798 [Coptis chinensis]
MNKAGKASNIISKDILEIIRQRKLDLAENKASPKQDILSHMWLRTFEDGQPMEERDIADKILGLIVGSHDTASTALTFVVKYLAKFPHIYNEVLKDILEHKFPTHKNAKHFLNSENFDPSRFEGKGPAPYTFVPFGGGLRMCPGIDYDWLVMLVFIHNLVTKFRWEEALPKEKTIFVPLAMPEKGLPIRLQAHSVNLDK